MKAWKLATCFTLLAAFSSPNLVQALDPIAILSPSDVPAGYTNLFGAPVAISGNYLVVGAYGDPWYDGSDTGAAYVFRRQGRAWIEQAKLTGSDTLWHAQLGLSVAIDGDVVVAGAPKWEAFLGCGSPDVGAAYVYRRDDQGTPDDFTDDTWPQEAKLTAPTAQAAERFAMSVAVSGDIIAVSAICGGPSVEVFRWNPAAPAAWVHEASLTHPKGHWGGSLPVAADGDRIVAGAYYNRDGPGEAYVFVHNGTDWVEEDVLTPNDHVTPDSFGASVDISGNYIAIGAPGIHVAYVFARQDGAWVQQARLTAPPEANIADFGGVRIDGQLAVVGGRGNPWAYLFRGVDSQWGDVVPLFGPEEPWFGSVAINGKFAVVSAHIYAVRDRHSLRDFALFQACFTRVATSKLPGNCESFDITGDGRLDLSDFEEFIGTLIGP